MKRQRRSDDDRRRDPRDLTRDLQTAEDELRAEQDAALRRYVVRVDAILAFGLPEEALPADEPHHTIRLVDAVRAKLEESSAAESLRV